MTEKIVELARELREMKQPLEDKYQNLLCESQNFQRQLDRYDALYRGILGDYMHTLDSQKDIISARMKLEGIIENPRNPFVRENKLNQ